MNTKQMARRVLIHRLATMILLFVTMVLSIIIPELLIKFTTVDSPLLLRAGIYLIMFSALGLYLNRIDRTFIKKYNRELESRAYTMEQSFRNQQIITEEDYEIMKELIADYEASHTESEK